MVIVMSSAYSTFVLKRPTRNNTEHGDTPSADEEFNIATSNNCEGVPESIKWEYTLRPGLWLSVVDIFTSSVLVFEYSKDQPMINYGFTLSGQVTNKVRVPHLAPVDYHNQKGCSSILYLPKREGEIHASPNQHVKLVHVHMSPEVFNDLFRQDANTVPVALDNAMNCGNGSYCFRGGIPHDIQSVLIRLIRGAPTCMPRHLFYESLVLELVAGQIGEANRQATGKCHKSLCGKERDLIIAAVELLTRDLISPPGLHKLSSEVGVNVNKLQEGFRHLYGMSVFCYLNTYKMQKAKMFFEQSDMNVSEAASAVGYSNISHFIAAFKKMFGLTPKKYLQEIEK